MENVILNPEECPYIDRKTVSYMDETYSMKRSYAYDYNTKIRTGSISGRSLAVKPE
jgi:hypothetical protein